MTDQYLAELAMKLEHQTEAEQSEPNLSTDEFTDQTPAPPAPPQENILETTPLPLRTAAHTLNTPTKEEKAAEELAAMILADLSEIEGCPKRGVRVAVYGSTPWNAWLSFSTDAGPVRNKADLVGFFDIITERLKRLYDVAS